MRVNTFKNQVEIKSDYIKKSYGDTSLFKNELFAIELLHGSEYVPRLYNKNVKKKEIVFERIVGRTVKENDELQLLSNEYILKDLAEFLMRLNEIKFQKVGYLSELENRSLVCFLRRKINRRLHSIHTLDGEQKEKGMLYFRKMIGEIDFSICEYNLVHYDLNPSNLMIRNGRLCVIDFDKASAGETEMDIAKFYWRTAKFNDDILEQLIKYLQFDVCREKIELYLFMHCIGAISFYDVLCGEKKKEYQQFADEAKKYIISKINV